MHVCTLRRVLCASETQKAAVSAVSRGTRRSRIALYTVGPRKQRMASLWMEGNPRCPRASRLGGWASLSDVMTDMNSNDRSYSFVASVRNKASVCANARGSNYVPFACVKPTRSYMGLAILRMRLVSLDHLAATANCTFLAHVYFTWEWQSATASLAWAC